MSASPIQAVCQLCGSGDSALRRAMGVRPAVAALIQLRQPNWSPDGWICARCLHEYQDQYVQTVLAEEKGELTDLEAEVLDGMRRHEVLARNTETDFEGQLTFGQRLADKIATFGGSWAFILTFAALLAVWIVINELLKKPFDPFPFILLNLCLSTLAAIQAPVIMMSQNRQEARDRARAMHDYQVNLKAELEIRQLHQKVDHLISRQWERLLEIQEIQLELIQEIRQEQRGS